MNRYEVINILVELAGPLGPYGILENRLEATSNWHKTLDLESLDVLLDILLNPPSEKEISKIPEYFEGEIVEALTSVGKRDIANFLKKIEFMLHIKQARPVMIDVIGGLRSQEGILLLEFLLEKDDLTDDELMRLTGALAETEGLKAQELLKKMNVLFSNRSHNVQEEIETWLKYFSEKT